MSKYVRRIIPFGSGDIPAVQRWLEDMVEKGCFSKSAACCLQSSQKASLRKCDIASTSATSLPATFPRRRRSYMSAAAGMLSAITTATS